MEIWKKIWVRVFFRTQCIHERRWMTFQGHFGYFKSVDAEICKYTAFVAYVAIHERSTLMSTLSRVKVTIPLRCLPVSPKPDSPKPVSPKLGFRVRVRVGVRLGLGLGLGLAFRRIGFRRNGFQRNGFRRIGTEPVWVLAFWHLWCCMLQIFRHNRWRMWDQVHSLWAESLFASITRCWTNGLTAFIGVWFFDVNLELGWAAVRL